MGAEMLRLLAMFAINLLQRYRWPIVLPQASVLLSAHHDRPSTYHEPP
jgi:hypothetical protein